MKLVLFGPPGAGKGTQARLLAKKYGVVQLSSGEILRRAIKDRTRLGLKALIFVNKGELVPDRIIIGLIEEGLKGEDCDGGFILDGFPRTLRQARRLDAFLLQRGRPLDRVINIEVPLKELVKRLSGRRICKGCAREYHLNFNPPHKGGRCNDCGGELEQRSDDHPDTIRKRFEVYSQESAPLIDYYRLRGRLSMVDGVGGVEQIQQRIIELVSTL